MNRTLLLMLLLALPWINGCRQTEELPPLTIKGFELRSANPEKLANWYVYNLGFEPRDGQMHSLTNANTSLSFAQLSTPEEAIPTNKRLPGLFKIGFKTSQLDALYVRLKRNGNDFRGEIFHDQNLNTRSLIVLDEDGNRVQFFEDLSGTDLSPYFFSIMALNFEEALTWCQAQMGFEEVVNLDMPERGLNIRLMKKGDVLLELISDERLSDEGGYIPGIESVLFNHSGSRAGQGKLIYTAGL